LLETRSFHGGETTNNSADAVFSRMQDDVKVDLHQAHGENNLMWNRKTAVSGLAICAVAVAGACADTQPTEPRAEEPGLAQLFGGTPQYPSAGELYGLDAEFASMAEEVPGFAGYFYDENMVLNVRMVPGRVRSAPEALQALRGRLEALGVTAAQLQGARILDAQYDAIQLATMHRQVVPVLSIDGVVYTDADEKANLVAIGVENARARASVEQAVGMLGLPAGAVVIRDAEPVVHMQTLQQRVRPVAGGLQINFPGFLCTLGVNVRSPHPAAAGVHGFLTNSHCTNVQWDNAAGQTWYAQPSGVASCPGGDCIGREVHDPQGFTGGVCPVGRICRYSDAAGARYLPGIENAFARIYRTTGVGSITIDQANPFYNIVAENPTNVAIGDSVFKVGRTTGFTRGVTTGSCVNTNLSPNFTYLCHDWITGPSGSVGGGDSGSSTWSRSPAGQIQNVRVNGLLCCGSGSSIFIHSPMSGVRTDNPPLNPAAPWRLFPPPPAP
jgi:hypothetical protein